MSACTNDCTYYAALPAVTPAGKAVCTCRVHLPIISSRSHGTVPEHDSHQGASAVLGSHKLHAHSRRAGGGQGRQVYDIYFHIPWLRASIYIQELHGCAERAQLSSRARSQHTNNDSVQGVQYASEQAYFSTLLILSNRSVFQNTVHY